MRRSRIALAVMVLALGLPLPGPAAAVDAPAVPDDGELVRVIDVSDGDTIRVEFPDGWWERIRYIGIDTPEIGHEPGQADAPWGREASDVNASLVEGRDVLLERDVSDTDRYERLLRYVWVETDDGWTMVNGELVAHGLADVRAYEPDTRHHAWFERLQDEAREAGRGMYRSEAPHEENDDGNVLDDILDFLFGG